MKRIIVAPTAGAGTPASPYAWQLYPNQTAGVAFDYPTQAAFVLAKVVIPDGTARDTQTVADIPTSVTTTDPITGETMTGPAQDVSDDPISSAEMAAKTAWAEAAWPGFNSADPNWTNITSAKPLLLYCLAALGLSTEPSSYMGEIDVAD